MSVAFSDSAPRPLAASDARRWEEEIVYVVIIEKFFNGEPALRRGNFTEVFSRDAVYVFLRTLNDDHILVVLNGSDRPKTFAMPIGDHAWRSIQLDDIISSGVTKTAGSEAGIQVEAFGARIMRVR
jgi:hypothetical protein